MLFPQREESNDKCLRIIVYKVRLQGHLLSRRTTASFSVMEEPVRSETAEVLEVDEVVAAIVGLRLRVLRGVVTSPRLDVIVSSASLSKLSDSDAVLTCGRGRLVMSGPSRRSLLQGRAMFVNLYIFYRWI